MKLKVTLTSIFLFAMLTGRTQPGTLDSDFSSDGKLNIAFNSSTNNVANAIVIQPNQKILVAGTYYDGSKFNAAVARINKDGTLDGSFGTDGKFTTTFAYGDTKFNAITLQSNGKIILAGSRKGLIGSETFLVVRLLSNGTPDSTFGGDGFVTTNIGTYCTFNAVVIQSDTLIVAGGNGRITGSSYNDFALVRYKLNGEIDSSFNVDGIVVTDFFGWNDYLNALIISKENKIMASGKVSFMGVSENRFGVTRYNSDGTLDISFSDNGKADYFIDSYDDGIYDMLIQPDNNILLGGHGATAAILMRIKSNGDRDSSFSDNGERHFWWGAGDNEIHGLALQPDGKILAAGFGDPHGTTSAFSVARINSNGIVDSTFGTNGINTSAFNLLRSKALCMALQNNGRVVVAGTSRSSSYVTDTVFAVARFYTGLNLGVLNFSQEQSSITVYPNPVSDFINIRYRLAKPETVSMRLFDIQGKLVATFIENEPQQEEEIEKQFLLPQNICSGVYLLNITSETGSVSIQIIKP